MNTAVRRLGRGLVHRACTAGAVVALAAAPVLLAAPAAHAAQKFNTSPSTTPGTVNCLSPEDRANYPGVCDGLTPTLSCTWDNGDGTFSAALGFENASSYTIEADAGSYQNSFYINRFTPQADGQPSFFRPGVSETEFVITWDPLRGDQVDWSLDGHQLMFSSGTGPSCAQHPVPILGNTTLLGITGGVAVCAFVVWNRRSLRRREWLRTVGHP